MLYIVITPFYSRGINFRENIFLANNINLVYPNALGTHKLLLKIQIHFLLYTAEHSKDPHGFIFIYTNQFSFGCREMTGISNQDLISKFMVLYMHLHSNLF